MDREGQSKEKFERLRDQLAYLLSWVEEDKFLKIIWAVDALQSNREEEARSVLQLYPPEAVTDTLVSDHAIYPWELETITNELLRSRKHPFYRSFDYRSWGGISHLIGLLRQLEDAEYGSRRSQNDVLIEMGRLGARQFPWQRGFFGVAQLYRSAFIYGQDECDEKLYEKTGLRAKDITLFGFSLLSVFLSEASLQIPRDLVALKEFGLSSEKISKCLERISLPLADLKNAAVELRIDDLPVAYQPSILRKFPCVLIGARGRTLLAPIPELIMDRSTDGIFYDVVGDGQVREGVGMRFEVYSISLLAKMIEDLNFLPESRYSTRLGAIDTPDVLALDDGKVAFAIECKATRMSLNAQYGESPLEDRGYEEIAKGVMQLWRFFSHCRRGLAPYQIADGVDGMVLTLDEWFAGRSLLIPKIYERAHELADASAHDIPAESRQRVAFCTISELESALSTATKDSLLEAVKVASGERAGWIFTILHSEVAAKRTEPRPYPFKEALHQLLPWYRQISEMNS